MPILTSDDLLIRAIRRGVDQGEYVYRRNTLLFGPGDPPAMVQVDEQAFVFTMSYAREHGIWPRPKEPAAEPGEAGPGAPTGGEVAPPPPLPPPTPVAGSLAAEGVLREALTRIWEQARTRRVARIALLRIRIFEGGGAFRFIVAASSLAGTQKHVSISSEYETTEGASFTCEFRGPLPEVLPVKDFLEPQLRAARNKETTAQIELRFDGGLNLSDDAAEKLTERLTRQPMGAAYVEAIAEIAVEA
jgi:hypothetical protein